MALPAVTLSCAGSQQRWVLDPAGSISQLMARLQLSSLAVKGGFLVRFAGQVPVGLQLPRSKHSMRGRVGNTSANQLVKRRDASGKLELLIPVIDGAASLAASDPAFLLAGQTIAVPELPSRFVTLKTLTGKSARLDVSGVATLGNLKAVVAATLKEGFPPEIQRILILGRQLDGDDRTLTELNLLPEATVYVVLRGAPPTPATGVETKSTTEEIIVDVKESTTEEIVVNVRMLTGKTIKITTRTADSVEALKEDIRRSEGIPADQQQLIFAGRQMRDDETLARYHICQGSVIHLVLRLRGGMMHESSGRDDHKPAARPASAAAIVRGTASRLPSTALRQISFNRNALFVGDSSGDELDEEDAAGSSGAGAGSAAVATPASRVAAFEAAFDAGGVTLEELYSLAEAAEEEE
jgi:hypothetical protein